jgi:hypothetical protein
VLLIASYPVNSFVEAVTSILLFHSSSSTAILGALIAYVFVAMLITAPILYVVRRVFEVENLILMEVGLSIVVMIVFGVFFAYAFRAVVLVT